MKKLLLTFCCLLLAGAALAQSNDDNPGSLWPADGSNPFLRRTARNVGDVITIVISENTSASWAATTATAKNDTGNVAQPNIPIIGGLFKALGISAQSSTSGQGTTTQTGTLKASMTAVVTKVMPNGNLVIAGTRFVKVNRDVQLVNLTGIVRPDDIQADNSVLSQKIADAEITTDGKGQIADRQRRGILTRLIDWIF